MSSSSSDLDNFSILESNRSHSISIDMWRILNSSIIISSKCFCSLMHIWLETMMFSLMTWPIDKFGIFIWVQFFSDENNRSGIMSISRDTNKYIFPTKPAYNMRQIIDRLICFPVYQYSNILNELELHNHRYKSSKNSCSIIENDHG